MKQKVVLAPTESVAEVMYLSIKLGRPMGK